MTALIYERDPDAIYQQSFAIIRKESRLGHLPAEIQPIAIRMIHASGMTDLADDLRFSADAVAAARAALANRAPILLDSMMLKAGIILRNLPAANDLVASIHDPAAAKLALTIKNTRSAAAVELWHDRLEGAVIVIGNAPTALFHLLELIDQGWPRPAVILGFPVGFVGAAESKAALAANRWSLPYMTLLGRRGGSAIAAAAINALAAGLLEQRL